MAEVGYCGTNCPRLNLFVHRLFELAELTGGEDKQRRSCFARGRGEVEGGPGIDAAGRCSQLELQPKIRLLLDVGSTPVAHFGSAWPEKPGQVSSRRVLKSWTLLKAAPWI